jgi:hypothetical protein
MLVETAPPCLHSCFALIPRLLRVALTRKTEEISN